MKNTLLNTDVAAYYSQARGSTQVPVGYTSPKYVKRISGGAPGKPFISNTPSANNIHKYLNFNLLLPQHKHLRYGINHAATRNGVRKTSTWESICGKVWTNGAVDHTFFLMFISKMRELFMG